MRSLILCLALVSLAGCRVGVAAGGACASTTDCDDGLVCCEHGTTALCEEPADAGACPAHESGLP